MPSAQHGATNQAAAVATTLSREVDPTRFDSAIDFIAAEHERQEQVCAVVECLAHNPRHGLARETLEALRNYFAHGYALHIKDEEEDLLPLLRERSPAEAMIGEVCAQLHREHAGDLKTVRAIRDELDRLLSDRALHDPAKFLHDVILYCETQRRHLAWENNVVLPRARRHLSAEDDAAMRRAMAARRGLSGAG